MSLVARDTVIDTRIAGSRCASKGGEMVTLGDGIATYCDVDGYIGLGMMIPPKKNIPVNKVSPTIHIGIALIIAVSILIYYKFIYKN